MKTQVETLADPFLFRDILIETYLLARQDILPENVRIQSKCCNFIIIENFIINHIPYVLLKIYLRSSIKTLKIVCCATLNIINSLIICIICIQGIGLSCLQLDKSFSYLLTLAKLVLICNPLKPNITLTALVYLLFLFHCIKRYSFLL